MHYVLESYVKGTGKEDVPAQIVPNVIKQKVLEWYKALKYSHWFLSHGSPEVLAFVVQGCKEVKGGVLEIVATACRHGGMHA